LAFKRKRYDPSVEHVTVAVKFVPKVPDTAETEHVAVPDALEKSNLSRPWMVSEKTTSYVMVLLELSFPTLEVIDTVGAVVSITPPVRAEVITDSSPAPFTFTARILI
jgi:hypothetical protein